MKLSFRNLSLLGLVLTGASAVTAAVLPNKPADDLRAVGSISNLGTDANVVTCTPTNVVNDKACNASTAAGSLTTVGAAAQSFEAGAQTVGNTTTR